MHWPRAVNCPDAAFGGRVAASVLHAAKVDTLGHPDVRVLVPDGDEIKIDQIRQVQADLSLRPCRGREKGPDR